MKRKYQSTLQRHRSNVDRIVFTVVLAVAFFGGLGFGTMALVNLLAPKPEDTSLLWRQPKEGKTLPPAPVLPATGNPHSM